jgi:hypothetical protein
MFAESIVGDLRSTRSASYDKQAGMLELEKMAAIGRMAVTLHSIPGITLLCFQSFSGI